MTSQVFYRKWRPQSLADVVGQEAVTRTLTNALATGRTAHAYLFCGPRGTGKTSTGRILAKAMNCLTTGGKGEPCNTCAMCQGITEGRAMDLIEIDAASNRGIDEIRSLREKVRYAPAEARYKVYIIDEVHMLTEQAFNALLKTLEEPPPNTIFILATTDAHKVPATIISRCQRFDFHRLSPQAIVARLRQVCDAEGIQAAPELLRAVARHAGGSLRDAENLLEQLAVSYGTGLKLEQVRELFGMGNDQRVRDLAKLILAKNVPGGLAAISAATLEGIDLRQLHRSLVEWLRAALLAKAGATDALDLDADAAADVKALAGSAATLEEIARAVKLFSQADVRADVQSPLPLELALVEFSQPPTAVAATPRAQQPSPAPRPPPAARSAAAPPRVAPFAAPVRPVAPPASRIPAMDAADAGDAPTARPRPAAPPAAQVALPPGVPSGMTPQEHLKANWAALLRQDRIPPHFHKNPGVYYVRVYAQPVAVEDGCITLEFNKAIYKELVEKLENRKEVEKLFEYILAKPYRLKCTLAAPGAATPQRQTAPVAAPTLRQATSGGHMVQALKDMGARVVTTSTPEKAQGDAPPAAREESQ
ncbi:MAG: DNA polymerase III subunit gamma/tau [Dehalococcoidia bacterium]|nr:DNA polymerase III subunit gamma/tau [Dehalococcoidia bacterium]